MCGIIGWVSTLQPSLPVKVWALGMAGIGHRGPDGEGTWVSDAEASPRVVLGHRRLAILDVSDAAGQPMVSPLSGSVLVFNGQIYNHAELKRELARFPYRGHGDTEVLCAALDQWGEAAISRLRGMFAFAWWQPRVGRLLVARDRLGEKPFYWSHNQASRTFAFASETRALLPLLAKPPAISRDGLADFIGWGSVSEPHTMWEGVRSLPAGHLGIYQSGRFEERPYWRPQKYLREVGFQGEDPKSILSGAVQSQLVADVPLGVFLSSGVDSAVIAYEARTANDRVAALTLAFADDPTDESAAARDTAARLGIRHATVTYRHEEIPQLFGAFLTAQDQPSIDGLNTWLIARAARSHGFKVMLSGVGGDELFMGYSSFRRLACGILKRHPLLASVGRVAGWDEQPRFQRLMAIWGAQTMQDALPWFRALWGPRQLATFGLAPMLGRQNGVDERDDLQALSLFELTHYLRNTLLRDSDAMSMANGLELRAPFLDYRLVESVLPLSSKSKLHAGVSKSLLKEWYADALGEQIVSRPKLGFGLPYERWLNNELAHKVSSGLETLSSTGLFSSGVFDRFIRNPSLLSVGQKLQMVVLGEWLKRSPSEPTLPMQEAKF